MLKGRPGTAIRYTRFVVATIEVEKTGDTVYTVTVEQAGDRTTHRVTATPEAVRRYGGGSPVERLLEESFRFLLEREPKEAILPSFELPVIERYFSEYPEEIRKRLA